ELPKLEPGSYIVEVTGKTNTSLAMLLISDITMVLNGDADQSYITLLDANTGKPVNSASVVVKEHYYDTVPRSVSKQGKTDKNGLYVYKKITQKNNNAQTSVFAWKDKHLTFSNAHYYHHYYDVQNAHKSYIYTDR